MSAFLLLSAAKSAQLCPLSFSRMVGRALQVFEDAYKSPLSIIILDDIER